MKVLYLIQSFKNLPQIIRLVTTIKRSSPQSAVLVCHNDESFVIDPSAFRDLSDVHVFHVSNISRVDFSIIDAYIDSIARARALNIEFDWVVNISGQCYPTRPLFEFEQLLATTSYAGFMDHCEVFVQTGRNSWDPREASGRYSYQYRWRLTKTELPAGLRKVLVIPRRIINNIQPFIHVDTRYALQIGVRSRANIFNDNFKLYGGTYFKTLSRRAVDYFCDFAQRRPDITNHFRNLNIPQEVFAQTVLLNNPDLTFSSDDLYYINLEGIKLGRPHTLTVSDYDTIVDRGSFFARKFEPDEDSRILDMLDARVLGLREVAVSA